MNIIFVAKKHGKSRSVAFNWPSVLALFAILCSVVIAAGWIGFRLATAQPSVSESGLDSTVVAAWQERLESQQREIDRITDEMRYQVDALTLRLGQLQSRVLRLDALGQRFVDEGLVSSNEFSFDRPPAVGGPETTQELEGYSAPELSSMINQLSDQITSRERQLRLLDTLMTRRAHEKERFVAGRPITWGWLSSRYGYRSDPFTGRRAWHNGVDLAGREGSDIIAVAAGVVTFAGDKHGYGMLVEIDHGEGLVTRYAHCKAVKVEAGEVVERGQVVALLGTTGRSTGPHVHFEVIQDGKSQNPEKYIERASR